MTDIDLSQYAVPQRQPNTGCIPTGYEILLRSASVEEVDLENFQEDLDLQMLGVGENNFNSVARAINARYPHVFFGARAFERGSEKLDFVDQCLEQERPVLLSVALGKNRGWHIVAVLGAHEGSYRLLWIMNTDGTQDVRTLPRSVLENLHDTFPGGNDVAYLERG